MGIEFSYHNTRLRRLEIRFATIGAIYKIRSDLPAAMAAYPPFSESGLEPLFGMLAKYRVASRAA